MLNAVTLDVVASVIASLVIVGVAFLYRNAIKFRLQAFILKNMKVGIQDVCDYKEARESFAFALEIGHSVKLMAIMGGGFLSAKDGAGRLHCSVLGHFLSTRSKPAPHVRVLLLDPRSSYVIIRAEKLFPGYHSQANQVRKIRNGILHSLDDLLDLKEEFGGLDVRIFNQKSVWRISIVNR